jgi:hypothetical protein
MRLMRIWERDVWQKEKAIQQLNDFIEGLKNETSKDS